MSAKFLQTGVLNRMHGFFVFFQKLLMKKGLILFCIFYHLFFSQLLQVSAKQVNVISAEKPKAIFMQTEMNWTLHLCDKFCKAWRVENYYLLIVQYLQMFHPFRYVKHWKSLLHYLYSFVIGQLFEETSLSTKDQTEQISHPYNNQLARKWDKSEHCAC